MKPTKLGRLFLAAILLLGGGAKTSAAETTSPSSEQTKVENQSGIYMVYSTTEGEVFRDIVRFLSRPPEDFAISIIEDMLEVNARDAHTFREWLLLVKQEVEYNSLSRTSEALCKYRGKVSSDAKGFMKARHDVLMAQHANSQKAETDEYLRILQSSVSVLGDEIQKRLEKWIHQQMEHEIYQAEMRSKADWGGYPVRTKKPSNPQSNPIELSAEDEALSEKSLLDEDFSDLLELACDHFEEQMATYTPQQFVNYRRVFDAKPTSYSKWDIADEMKFGSVALNAVHSSFAPELFNSFLVVNPKDESVVKLRLAVESYGREIAEEWKQRMSKNVCAGWSPSLPAEAALKKYRAVDELRTSIYGTSFKGFLADRSLSNEDKDLLTGALNKSGRSLTYRRTQDAPDPIQAMKQMCDRAELPAVPILDSRDVYLFQRFRRAYFSRTP